MSLKPQRPVAGVRVFPAARPTPPPSPPSFDPFARPPLAVRLIPGPGAKTYVERPRAPRRLSRYDAARQLRGEDSPVIRAMLWVGAAAADVARLQDLMVRPSTNYDKRARQLRDAQIELRRRTEFLARVRDVSTVTL